MYADGCVYSDYAKLDLKTDDIKLLEDIAFEIKNTCPIKTYEYKKNLILSIKIKLMNLIVP